MKKLSHEIFRKAMIVLLFCVVVMANAPAQQDKPMKKDLDMSVMVNQAGYLIGSSKYCVSKGAEARDFEVLNAESGASVYKGKMLLGGKDLGDYVTGDFSSVKQPGIYYIRSGDTRSFPFRISKNVYEPAMQMVLSYFSTQRCGNSTTGYLTPCHLDDGVRLDNHKHQDVTGGWHDASDLRKWTDATIYGMVGILRMAEMLSPLGDNGQISEELRWGNRYFLNMQEPAGYLISHVGGDVFKHADSNRWTDNEIGTDDDRIIQTKPAESSTQFTFIAVQAEMSRFTRNDPAYSRQCLDAAVSCFNWCTKTIKDYNASMYGSSIIAGVELYKTTGDKSYLDFAFDAGNKMLQLQVVQNKKTPLSPQGFFKASAAGEDFCSEIYRGDLILIGLCKLMDVSTQHPERQKYVEAIKRYCYDYVKMISEKNAFALLPYGMYSKNPGGNRKIGNYWYRYFMFPDAVWWVGINANITGKGVGLVMASRILNDPFLMTLAQRQLDWVLGSNPFGMSTMKGVGYSHPDVPMDFVNSGEFRPATPYIPGAVLNGIGGDADDMPDLFPRSWQTGEYWTPMICYTLWLMAEISFDH